MSWSQTIWHERRTLTAPLAVRTCRSAAVIRFGSPSMNSTRHVVQRALPPHACSTSTCASCSIASTRRFPFSTSTVPKPSTVNFAIVLDSPCTGLSSYKELVASAFRRKSRTRSPRRLRGRQERLFVQFARAGDRALHVDAHISGADPVVEAGRLHDRGGLLPCAAQQQRAAGL